MTAPKLLLTRIEPRRCTNVEEAEVHSRWRRIHTANGRPGSASEVKRRSRRRERREAAAALRRAVAS